MKLNDDDQIRRRAHNIWESEGRPHGQDAEHWQRARHEIESEAGVKPGEVAPRSPIQRSLSDPVQDGASLGRKRKAASTSSADGEMSSTIRKDRGTPIKADSGRGRGGTPAKSATKRQGNMPSELGGRRGEHSDAPPPAKYRHPENPDLTWSGRGRRPAWIREAVGAGRALSDFENDV